MGRIVVIGLDAFHEGLFEYSPNIAKLTQENPSGSLESTTPPVTAPAWASFQTGCNQGKHGIYDFVSYDDNKDLHFLDGTDLQARTLYEYLDQDGQDCLLFNLPFSLPGRVNGDIVPSWLDPDDANPVPGDLYESYDIEPPKYPKLKGSRNEKIAEMNGTFQHNSQQFLSLLQAGDHDFLFQLISVTDWLQHNGYRELVTEPESDEAKAAQHLLGEVDDYVDRIHSELDDDDRLILMSDHGFRLFDGRFYINDWLCQLGLLTTGGSSLETKEEKGGKTLELGSIGQLLAKQEWMYPVLRRIKHTLEGNFNINFDWEGGIDFEKSVAYCLSKDECAIRLDKSLPDDRRNEIVNMILREMRDEVGVSASRGSDIYHGPFADAAGEVVVHSEEYRATRGPVGRIRTGEEEAYHSQHGFLTVIGSNNGDTDISGTKLIDIAPTLLAISDIPVPESMDGSPISELTDSVEYKNYPKFDPDFNSEADRDMDKVEERLGDLGYL